MILDYETALILSDEVYKTYHRCSDYEEVDTLLRTENVKRLGLEAPKILESILKIIVVNLPARRVFTDLLAKMDKIISGELFLPELAGIKLIKYFMDEAAIRRKEHRSSVQTSYILQIPFVFTLFKRREPRKAPRHIPDKRFVVNFSQNVLSFISHKNQAISL